MTTKGIIRALEAGKQVKINRSRLSLFIIEAEQSGFKGNIAMQYPDDETVVMKLDKLPTVEFLAEETKAKMGEDRAKAQFMQHLIPMLEKAYSEGAVEFSLKMQSDKHFIVHPSDRDGDTIDINWGKV